MDPIDLLTGAGILLSGGLGGYLFGLRHKRPPRPPRPPKEVCQCDHPSSMHNKGGCLATVPIATKWDGWGDPIKWEKSEPCPCIRYVGPHSSYVPELEG